MDCYHCKGPCDTPKGYCHCGCGRKTPKTTGAPYPEDTYWKFVNGHQAMRGKTAPEGLEDKRAKLKTKVQAFEEEGICPWCGPACDVGAGYCHCGCGQVTNFHDKTAVTQDKMLGLPCQWLKGHSLRKTRTMSDDEVARARFVYATTDATQDDLAEEFGVTRWTMQRILNYDTRVEAGIATGEETA